MTEIRIYFEGDRQLRPALGSFLGDLRGRARQQRIRWEIIACGPRLLTFNSFKRALIDHPDAFVLLLVDSEGPVELGPWEHLKRRQGDEWELPGVDDSQCHLMVQMMEAWFIADIDALKEYYGQGFNEKAIPKNSDVEQIDKEKVLQGLRNYLRT
jgi:Domain of unknown function (DUF4276)